MPALHVSATSLRRLAWLMLSLPMIWLVYGALTVQLGANPVETLEHETGSWALIFLLMSLSVTPLRKLTGWNQMAPLRRTFGLFAFAYALLHVLIYLLLDRTLLISEIIVDLTKRPYVMIGMGAFGLLALLALTSPKSMVRRLGALQWKRLHRLVYVAAGLGVLHFAWLKWDKNLLERPTVYGLVLLALLGWRIWNHLKSVSQDSSSVLS